MKTELEMLKSLYHRASWLAGREDLDEIQFEGHAHKEAWERKVLYWNIYLELTTP